MKKRGKKIPVTTTIDPDILAWVKEQTDLSNWIDKVAKEFIGLGLHPDDIRNLQRRIKFFANKTIDLQAEINEIKQKMAENSRKGAVFDRKLKKIEEKNREKRGKTMKNREKLTKICKELDTAFRISKGTVKRK